MSDKIKFHGKWTAEEGIQVIGLLTPFFEQYPLDSTECYYHPGSWGNTARYKALLRVNGCICGRCVCAIASPAFIENAFTLFMKKLRNFYTEEGCTPGFMEGPFPKRSDCPHKTNDQR